jgi:ribonuclease HI
MGLDVIRFPYYTVAFDGCDVDRHMVKKDKDNVRRGRGAGGVLILHPDEHVIAERCQPWRVPTTNNESELRAMILGLEMAREMKLSRIFVVGDSQLALNLVFRRQTTRLHYLLYLIERAQKLLSHWSKKDVRWDWRPRSHAICQRADELAKAGLLMEPTLKLKNLRRRHKRKPKGTKSSPLDTALFLERHRGSKSVRVARRSARR